MFFNSSFAEKEVASVASTYGITVLPARNPMERSRIPCISISA